MQKFAAVFVVALSACASLSDSDRQAIAGKTYVITGASSGFGRGTALALGAMHANVVIAARRTNVLEDVATQIRAAGGNALVVTTDVSHPDEMVRLRDAAVAKFSRIDVWINDVGVGVIAPFTNAPIEDYSRLVDVNFKSVVYGTYVALQQFERQRSGTLVNVGSIDSEVPLAYQAAYSATKAAVLSLSRALNEELRLAGLRHVHVAVIMPWASNTPWWDHAANYSGKRPNMIGMDDPQKIVNAMVWLSLHPQEELSVGWKAKGSYISHHLLPDLTERISADLAHRYQMETPPPASPTKGTLYDPMQQGQDVKVVEPAKTP